jgi:hypothetical protein
MGPDPAVSLPVILWFTVWSLLIQGNMVLGAARGARDLINRMCLQSCYANGVSLADTMGGELAADKPIPLITNALALASVCIYSLLLFCAYII